MRKLTIILGAWLVAILIGVSFAVAQTPDSDFKRDGPKRLAKIVFVGECGEVDAVYEWLKEKRDGRVPEYYASSKQQGISPKPVDMFITLNKEGAWSVVMEYSHPRYGNLGCVVMGGEDFKKLTETQSEKKQNPDAGKTDYEKKIDKLLKEHRGETQRF